MSKSDGGPAFPESYDYELDSSRSWGGLSLRDWFAGQALAGMALPIGRDVSPYSAAVTAYRYADAMLAAREEG